MSLLCRMKKLEPQHVPIMKLTVEEQHRIDELISMNSDHPDFNMLEFLELNYKANPDLSFMLCDAEDEW